MRAVLSLVILTSSLLAGPNDRYAAPFGRADGDGSISRPWDLATALNGGNVQPGQTLWLRGGAYVGAFYSRLTGASQAPITVRSYPGERAILADVRARGNFPTLNIRGAWTNYRDFDVTNVNPDREWKAEEYHRPSAIEVIAPHIKLINLVIHDAGNGIGFWDQTIDSEIYGCIIFNNGQRDFSAGGRGHGHGIYAQNREGVKRIADNLVFSQFGWGIHLYPNPGGVEGFLLQGNSAFENGRWVGPGLRYNNLLVAGFSSFTADRITVEDNYLYNAANQTNTGNPTDANACFGCYDPDVNGSLTLRGNYFFNGVPPVAAGPWADLQATGNTVIAPGLPRPSGVTALVQANEYESGRGQIVVLNWGHRSFVDVDLSSVLRPGDPYEIRNAQNYRADPVLRGTYAGGQVRLPLTALTVASPYGLPGGALAQDEFQAFLVQRENTAAFGHEAWLGSYRTLDGDDLLRIERSGSALAAVVLAAPGSPRIELSPLVDRVYRLEGLPEGVVAHFEPVTPELTALVLVTGNGLAVGVRTQ